MFPFRKGLRGSGGIWNKLGDRFAASGDNDFLTELHTIEQPAELVFGFESSNLNHGIPPSS